MNSTIETYRLPLIAAVSLLLLGFGGVAFYGWLRFGSSILLTLGETGLSWCF
ncbi:hypothetical protein [Neorhizobium galegae]|uniref:Uncharacterized protein n=1 Tax=Neorhizobium galegae bv. orientalis str. HAMBI 540 TaxID=1028800 RepID=A0A068SPV6_NEOGA|nr:hypothetical protein [Neorhizobium galegae]CDN48332.1 Hypothetical protein RG540_CH21640 [Neorhizobium galegae bv. orientalis str. HAMBI 540]CDZ46161.1 Hypothetical protein NGAL_HAMBI2427_15450 [Neorhizobium galegae bv. orientalis]